MNPYNTNLPPDLRASQGGDRGLCARLRPGFLRDDLRGHRRRRPQRDRGLRRLPDALPALVVRHVLRGAAQGLRLRAVEDLRDGHQQRSVLRLPDAQQPYRRSEAGDGPRLRALRFLQEQRLLRPHQPQDDGRDGQPRRPHPPLCREVRRGRGRDVRGPLHVDRRPDRRPFDGHPPPRAGVALRLHAGTRRATAIRRRASRPRTTWTTTSTRATCSRRRRRSAERRRSRPRATSPSSPRRTCCCSSIEHAPLKGWQRDILSIIRDEAYYFAPQGQTKIMNEGWASYWHSHHHDPEGPARRPR